MINITPPGYTLTVNIVGDGTVTKNPDQATYTAKPVQTPQLTATAASGYSFSGWSGLVNADGDSSSGNIATVVMKSSKTVTATFAQTPATLYTLTVNLNPSSGGTVGQSPSAESYSAGTQVTLTAMPNANYTFGSWSSVDSSSGTTAYVTMGSANRSVTANFTASSPPPPSGSLGTKTNPIPMNQIGGRGTTYFPSVGNIVPLKANEKKWFVVDSLAATGRSVTLFIFNFKTYNNSKLVYTKVPQSKATGQDL
jgi:hypothetical protein